MAQRRSDLIFETEESGSIFMETKEGPNMILEGSGTSHDRGLCRFALRLYDLGSTHKALEIRKALGTG